MWQRCSVGVEPLKHFSSPLSCIILCAPSLRPEISVSPATASAASLRGARGGFRFVFVLGGLAHNALRFITPERLTF
jgi:hypothetical protein